MKIAKTSAIDITLKGSVGSFKVGRTGKNESLEVKYILTHVGLNFDMGGDEKLLKELAPVREIFDFKSLDFDEIMQRDIDDARVSSELIPYILDESSTDLIKFFPPIVVVVLPVESDRNKPAKYYPKLKIEDETRKDDESGVDIWKITQSGDIGNEVFKFEQPIVDDEVLLHDLVSLKLNTSKCRLVIVDGQHRAMALLALYRNLKDDWTDARRKPFESYYQEWTPDYIKTFNLKEIKLPMIVCTIPNLDSSYEKSKGDYDLKKASRSIFLTLNKHARKVSRSRNLLLDDSDLISSFMRMILSEVKNNEKNHLAKKSLEIHNIELDQSGDKQKISSPMAFTGVSHLYYIVEHLLLDSGDVNGVKKREGRFSTRTKGQYFTNALTRLDCENKLGKDALINITRNIFTRNDEWELGKEFMMRYGVNILKAYSDFLPFELFSRATQKIKNDASSHADIHITPMLFDGQGIAKVFEDHRVSLKQRLAEGYFKHDVPKIEEFNKGLNNTNENYQNFIDNFRHELAINYLNGLSSTIFSANEAGKVIIFDKAKQFVDTIYDQIFSVIAFQAAFVCGFYTEFEKFSDKYSGDLSLDVESLFSEYVEQMNNFFKPSSFSKAKALINLFIGECKGENFKELEIVKGTPSTYRNIVFPGEMAPDEWPKYRYLMLELWEPNNAKLQEKLDLERIICRKQIIKSLYSRNLKSYCQENGISEDSTSNEEKLEVYDNAYNNYKDMLKNIEKASVLQKTELKNVCIAS